MYTKTISDETFELDGIVASVAFNKRLLNIHAHIYFNITFIYPNRKPMIAIYIIGASQGSSTELQISLADKRDHAMARTPYITHLIISIKIYNYFPI